MNLSADNTPSPAFTQSSSLPTAPEDAGVPSASVVIPKDFCPEPLRVGDIVTLEVQSIDPDTGEATAVYSNGEEDESENEDADKAEEKVLGYKRPKINKETPSLKVEDLES